MLIRVVLSVFVIGWLWAQAPTDWKELVRRGADLLERGRTAQATEAFQRAVNLAPNEIQPHLCLGESFMKMSMFLLESPTPENTAAAKSAEKEFRRVLELDRGNVAAMRSIASLKFLDAQGRKDAAEKRRGFDEACDWYQKALAVEPRDKESHFMLGLVALTVFNSEWNAARARLKMKPETDGLLPDAAVRADLRARFGKVINDSMGHLRRAAEIDPQYSSALVTLNSLLREYASLSDTAGECRRLEAEADRWGEQGLAAQRQASGNGRTSSGAASLPPPPPPPPPPPVQWAIRASWSMPKQ